MQLSDVSLTAIATLRCRVIESKRRDPLIRDPMASVCLEGLEQRATRRQRALLFDRRLSRMLIHHIALRARRYDAIADAFIREHPDGLVVNLGCGFDTRYWRIRHERCTYVELDLPGVIDLKKEVLSGHIEYAMIGASVLDHSWMDRLDAGGSRKVLFLAEGLLMYLPKREVVVLLGAMAARFPGSRIVMEVVSERYTRGLWKRIVTRKMKRQLGYDAGASYDFGIRDAREIESYGEGLRVVDEWSFVDDPDVRPRILRYLGVSRSQWTVTLDVSNSSP